MAGFAVRLRTLRKERGLRQVDLAAHLGIAQTTIANYEQHARFPDEEKLLEMARYFNVSLDYLLGRSDVSVHPNTLVASSFSVSPDPSSLGPTGGRFLSLLREGKRNEAIELVVAAAEGGESVRSIYETVLTPVMRVVGTLWETGEMDISEEHFVSESTQMLMSRLHPYLKSPSEHRGNVVLAGAGAEQHVIGMRMVGDLLEEAGWLPYYVGGIIPVVNVVHAITSRRARVLAISVTMTAHVDSAAHIISHVRSLKPTADFERPLMIVGGLPFNLDPELWSRIGADGHARSGLEAVDLVNQLTQAPVP